MYYFLIVTVTLKHQRKFGTHSTNKIFTYNRPDCECALCWDLKSCTACSGHIRITWAYSTAGRIDDITLYST